VVLSKLRQKSLKRHLVRCPHCGRDVLDHMAACPFCDGALQPLMRQDGSDEQLKRLKNTLRIVGFAVAALLLLWRLMGR